MTPTIPVGFLGDVMQAARYLDWDIEPVLKPYGLSLEQLDRDGLRVSVDLYSNVLRSLGQATGDAFFGFLSRPIPIRAFDVFCQGLVGCRTLEEVLTYANEFYALFTPEFSWRVESVGPDVAVVARLEQTLPVDYRFVIQSLLLMALRLFGWLFGEDVEIKSVEFSFEKNATDERLSYLYGNSIKYGRPTDRIVIDSSYAGAKLACTKDEVTAMLKGKRDLFLITRHRSPLSHEVRRLLLSSKDEDWLEIEAVAVRLGMSPNYLWRRLKKEGSSFLDIRTQIKRDWALVLLEDPSNTVEFVADTLRYTDVSAFRKAFKKWTGLQPVQYRNAKRP